MQRDENMKKKADKDIKKVTIPTNFKLFLLQYYTKTLKISYRKQQRHL